MKLKGFKQESKEETRIFYEISPGPTAQDINGTSLPNSPCTC